MYSFKYSAGFFRIAQIGDGPYMSAVPGKTSIAIGGFGFANMTANLGSDACLGLIAQAARGGVEPGVERMSF